MFEEMKGKTNKWLRLDSFTKVVDMPETLVKHVAGKFIREAELPVVTGSGLRTRKLYSVDDADSYLDCLARGIQPKRIKKSRY